MDKKEPERPDNLLIDYKAGCMEASVWKNKLDDGVEVVSCSLVKTWMDKSSGKFKSANITLFKRDFAKAEYVLRKAHEYLLVGHDED